MNHWEKYLNRVSVLLFAGASLCCFLTYAFVTGTSFNVMKNMHDASNPKDPLARHGLDISGHRMENSKFFKSGYEALARFDDIEAPRFISFSATVPLKELLNHGEKLPSPAMTDVFAKARAFIYAQKECERIKSLLASRCEVSRAKGTIKDRFVRINATVKFVQKTSFGVFDETKPLSFHEVSTSLKVPPSEISIASEVVHREKFYRKALKECEEIKAREGNCAITGISISARFSNRTRKTSISAKSSYGLLLAS